MTDIIRRLQQRIDKRSNYITESAVKYEKNWKPAWKEVVEAHTLDKRLMGALIKAEREYKEYRKMALKIIAQLHEGETNV